MLVKDIGLTAERVRFVGHVLWFGLGLHKFLVEIVPRDGSRPHAGEPDRCCGYDFVPSLSRGLVPGLNRLHHLRGIFEGGVDLLVYRLRGGFADL